MIKQQEGLLPLDSDTNFGPAQSEMTDLDEEIFNIIDSIRPEHVTAEEPAEATETRGKGRGSAWYNNLYPKMEALWKDEFAESTQHIHVTDIMRWARVVRNQFIQVRGSPSDLFVAVS